MATAKRTARKNTRGHGDVHDPDVKIVFAVLAVAMLVGALLTGPSKAPARLQSPAQASAATSSR